MPALGSRLVCIECGREQDAHVPAYSCSACGGLLTIDFDFSTPPSLDKWTQRPFGVWRYCELLPVEDSKGTVTLGEGGTSLHNCLRLGEKAGLANVLVKNEGENPTGSFKDRGMTVAMTKALELGATRVACASTGNTSASMAAYAARAGLVSVVLIPSGRVAMGKLSQAIAHGAKVVQVRGNFDEAMEVVREVCSRYSVYLLNSINPYRLEGQKTLAFELWEQLGRVVPDAVVVPVGNAGNISAIWKGFTELRSLGLTESLPKMMGVQAEGAAPIARAFKEGKDAIKPIADPDTLATAIRIGSPVSWRKALWAVKKSGGLMEMVSDEEILEAQAFLARGEGIFVEPASAASIAGLLKISAAGSLDRTEKVVCVTTGHGLKDQDIILRRSPPVTEVDPSADSVAKALGLM